jgi:hypothetical protein
MSVKGMSLMRRALARILQQAQEGNVNGVIQTAHTTLQALDATQLLTTREAADIVGIRSINTLKALVIRNGIPYRKIGNRMMLSLAEVEGLKASPLMRGIRASEAVHDTLDALGQPGDLSAEELQDLEAARPGHLPWRPAGTTPPATRDAQETPHDSGRR